MPNQTGSQPSQPALPPLSILRMLWKRKWLVVGCWLTVTAAAVSVVHLLPSVYKAEAVVLVDSQKIPEAFVSPTVTGDIADRLALISQSIMTSSRLLALINRFGLYRKDRARLTQDELLQQMRRDISIKVENSWTGGRMQAFRLGYQGNDPKTVAEVTNQLAGLYVAENRLARETQAEATVDFLHRQLDDAKASLDKQESAMAQFKLEHNGSLPEQENALLGNLSSLRLELQGVQDNINQVQQTKDGLKAALAVAEASEATLASSVDRSSRPSTAGLSDVQLLEEQLRDLRKKYTPEYPEVQAVMQEIKEAKQEEMQALATAEPARSATPGGPHDATAEPGARSRTIHPELLSARERITTIRAQIDAATRQMESLRTERDELLAKIADCQRRVEQLPIVEQQMAALKRNYDESANHYNSLLQKELSAGMATDMERSHDSERFTVIDPARVPQKPIKPKRIQLATVGSIAGLAIGLLCGFALEFRKQTFLGEWELPPGVVVLGRVPTINTVGQSAPVTAA